MSKELTETGDAALEAAAAWHVRLQDAAATGDDWLAFERWLAADPAHLAAYEQVEALSLELDGHAEALRQALAPSPAELPSPAFARRAHRGPARHAGLTRRAWMGAAGGAIAAGLAAVIMLQPGSGQDDWTQGATIYEAPSGQTREVRLADGTRVRLNAGSRIAVRLDRNARHVVMADAEAVFDVAHDPNRPFLIRAGDREVRVVGTEFNLRRRAGQVVLTVRRGIVEVRPADAPTAHATRVTVGQQLVHFEGAERSSLAMVDPEDAFGWTSGRLTYRDAPLADVAADLGRRFGRAVRVADAETGRIRFTGVLVLDQEAAVLRRLSAYAPVEAERAADGSITLRRRP